MGSVRRRRPKTILSLWILSNRIEERGANPPFFYNITKLRLWSLGRLDGCIGYILEGVALLGPASGTKKSDRLDTRPKTSSYRTARELGILMKFRRTRLHISACLGLDIPPRDIWKV